MGCVKLTAEVNRNTHIHPHQKRKEGRKRTQLVSAFQYKHEDQPEFDPWHPHKKLNITVCTCNLITGEEETGGCITGACRPAKLGKRGGCRLSKRLWREKYKERGRDEGRKERGGRQAMVGAGQENSKCILRIN